jgi:hypothetical protein
MLTPADEAQIAAHLGRRLRGVVAVAARCPAGHPCVITCYPLRPAAGRVVPFPTLYWLVCPRLHRAVADLERRGAVGAIEAELSSDPAMMARLVRDHDDYITRRWATLNDEDRLRIESRGMRHGFLTRGIGGMLNRGAVKCLHLHIAHELVSANAIGARAMRKYGLARCAADPSDGPGP